jgi:hypothetical protein
MSNQILDRFVAVGLTPDAVRQMEFLALVEKLKEAEVLAATAGVLGLFGQQHVDTRVFLAAYMVAYKSTDVFDATTRGEREQALFNQASVLMEQFSGAVELASASGVFTVPEGFGATMVEYLGRFEAWKVPDQQRIVARIKTSLKSLHEHVGDADVMNNPTMASSFQDAIAKLWDRLEKFEGAAAVAAFRAQLAQEAAGNVA